MGLSAGTRLGSYEISAAIGEAVSDRRMAVMSAARGRRRRAGKVQSRYEWVPLGAGVVVSGRGRTCPPLGTHLAECGSAIGRNPASGAARTRCLHRHLMALRANRLSQRLAGTQARVRPGRAAAALLAPAPVVTPLLLAAAGLQAVCEAHRWRYCFIGGLAVLRWGEPRETVDVGLTLMTGFGQEDGFISTLMASFEPRIPDAAEFARANRVLLLRASSGVGLDIALGGLAFEEGVVERASLFTYPPDIPLRTCSAEDLIVLKAFADRPKDWMDIEGVIIRQGATQDWPYIRTQLAALAELKETPGLLETLERARTRFGSP
jgi:hypothetical protein